MQYKNLTLTGIRKLAQTLVKPAKSGMNPPRIFGLIGPLGAGKTTFAQALAQTLGIKNAKSPTFTIVHCYDGLKKSLYHIDLYRLENDKQLNALGLDEMLDDQDNLVAIEWVDKFPALEKRCDVIIKFEIAKNNLRHVTVTNN